MYDEKKSGKCAWFYWPNFFVCQIEIEFPLPASKQQSTRLYRDTKINYNRLCSFFTTVVFVSEDDFTL